MGKKPMLLQGGTTGRAGRRWEIVSFALKENVFKEKRLTYYTRRNVK
jgi:hypothetical protein